MSLRWPVLLAGVALIVLGALAWGYGSLTMRTRTETVPVPTAFWSAYP